MSEKTPSELAIEYAQRIIGEDESDGLDKYYGQRIAEVVEILLDFHKAAQPKWITVKGKLPKTPGMYWVFRRPKYPYFSLHPVAVREWDGETWQSKQTVTHWLPLIPTPEDA